MTEHTVKKFDTELENIRSRVLAMGGLVEQQITSAMDGLASGNLDMLDAVIKNDEKVNRHEVELDEACAHIIAKRQPTAIDLRMVMMVIKTITDLERIGDEAKKIAKRGRAMHRDVSGKDSAKASLGAGQNQIELTYMRHLIFVQSPSREASVDVGRLAIRIS